MPKLSKGIQNFLLGSRRAAAAGFIAYMGLGGLAWAKNALPPLDTWLSYLCSAVAAVGLLTVTFVGLKAVFGSKD